jgi:hypothetical protein
MHGFSFGKLAAKIILLLLSFFLLISAFTQFNNFLKSVHIKVANAKVALYPVYKQVSGISLFISYPVYASIEGRVEKLMGNYSLVNKGDLVGRIKNEKYSVDIIAPCSGVIVWGEFDKYFSSEKEIFSYTQNVHFNWSSESVNKNTVVCSIIQNDHYFIHLKGDSQKNRIYIYLNGSTIPFYKVYNGKDYVVFEGNQFLKYFLNKNTFELLSGFRSGVKIKRGVVAKYNGKEGIFIVENGVIHFTPAKIFSLHNDYLLADIGGIKKTIIVVETPKLVKDNEIFSE